MAKKGMKNWFGFGKKEAKEVTETQENEATVNENVEENSAVDNSTLDNIDTAGGVGAEAVPGDVVDTATVIESAVLEKTDVALDDESETTLAVDSDSSTEQTSEFMGDAPTEAPKWYQFGKKKQLKQTVDQAEDKDTDTVSTGDVESEAESVAAEDGITSHAVNDTVVSAIAIEQAPISTETTVAEISAESVVADTIETVAQADVNDTAGDVETGSTEPEQQDKFLTRLKRGLSRTKGNIGSGFKNLFRGKHIDDALFEELEEQLLIADLGVATTTRIIDNLTQQASRKELKDAEALYDILKKDMAEMLHKVDQPLVIDSSNKPYVILMVGVNGVGKTTTIGKMAKKFQAEGKSVMLAAGDTFRAAAVEQLQVWGERNNIPVVAQHTGADSASVLFDAMQSATAKNIDVLIADTAGRLQNKKHLMEELKKVLRVMRKHDASAPHEIMLTIDAGTGQNALSQAELFKEAVGLTGIALTKLDGTAKGGVIFAVADKFEIPIRFIGIGEGIDDLRTFNAEEFIDALFSSNEDK